MAYQPRVTDSELESRLRATGAVVIEGPRACGKTASARRLAASEVLFDLDPAARHAARVDPSLVLEGATPRLLDEWQLEPQVWNAVRRAVDDSDAVGRFILTGSAVPADEATRHTGAGRIARMRMRPMSLYELGFSTGEISLEALLDGDPPRSRDPGLSVADLAVRVAVGGWPGFRSHAVPDALVAVRGYLEEIRRTDIGRVDDKRRDPVRVGRLLRSLARNVATYAATKTLAADAGGDDGPIKDETAAEYLDALTRLMVVEDQPAWAPHLRSKSRIRRAEKRHFVDPSLAVAALHATPERLLEDINYLGFLFESLVIRDLRVYAQGIAGTVLQYRDNTGLEVDAIVETADGRWGAFEIKLGGRLVEEGASNLTTFVNRVDTAKPGKPAIVGVITGTGYGYVRPDGIAVIPIGALAP